MEIKLEVRESVGNKLETSYTKMSLGLDRVRKRQIIAERKEGNIGGCNNVNNETYE